MKKITVILGATSTGKTSLAIDLCKKYDGQIISADSRQIYKYMNIGTGKVPISKTSEANKNVSIFKSDGLWEIDGVNIWGYDLVEPDEFFSAYDYALWALEKSSDFLEKDGRIFLVGGTGFYVDLFTGKIEPSGVAPNFELREKLEKFSLQDLQEKLMSLNKKVYKKIDKNNLVRLIRAIEIELGKKNINALPYLKDVDFEYIGLDCNNDFLYSRVDKWVDAIWEGGLVSETEKLIDLGYKDCRPLNGLIYSTVKKFIAGRESEEDSIQRIKYDLHSYVRRQKTYFAKNKSIMWFDIKDDNFSQKVLDAVQFKLDG